MKTKILLLSLIAILTGCASSGSSSLWGSIENIDNPQERSGVFLSDASLNNLVVAVLSDKNVSIYLHPQAPGRLPIKVHFKNHYQGRSVDGEMYGQKIVTLSKTQNPQWAVNLDIVTKGNTALIKVSYKPEGIWGRVQLSYSDEKWSTDESTILE